MSGARSRSRRGQALVERVLVIPIVAGLRSAIAAHLNRSERGITFVLFALAIVVILGMVALGIDGGRLFDERRHAAAAADHAALAAAYASCASASSDPAALLVTARAAGLASAASNGYDNNGTTNQVTITRTPGSLPADHKFQAQVETTIDATFARAIGFSELDTGAVAQAQGSSCDSTGSGTGAIHAGGTSCPGGSHKTVEISGNNNDTTGKTYAYGGFWIAGGNDNDFLNTAGPSVEYAGSWEVTGSGNDFDQPKLGPVAVPTETFPDGWAPSDQTTTMWDAYFDAAVNSDKTTDKFVITTNGIYYTDRPGGVVVEIPSITVTSITIVNRSGPITIGEPYIPPLGERDFAAYPAPAGGKPDAMVITGFNSNGKPCDDDAIRRSGDGGNWDGIWWAPNGLINTSGSSNDYEKGLIAHAVHFRGGNNNRAFGGSGVAAAAPGVFLTE